MNRQEERVRPSRSLFLRFTAFALLTSIPPILFISSLLLWRMENMTEQALNQSYRWLASEHAGYVAKELEQYGLTLRYTARNTTILDTLASREGNAYQRGKTVSAEMFKSVAMENYPVLRNCMIYSLENRLAYGSHVTMFTEAEDALWRRRGWDGEKEWFLNQSWDGKWLLSFICPMTRVDVQSFAVARVGLIKMDVLLERLAEPYSISPSGETQDYQVLLLDERGECLYASGGQSEQAPADWRAWAAGEPHNFGTYTALAQPLSDYGLSLIYLCDNKELIQQKQSLKRMLYPILLALAAVIVLCDYWFFRRFSARIDRLVEKFRVAGAGDWSPSAPIGGEDEIAMLDRQFGTMLGEMSGLHNRTLAQQSEIREAQYRNLQLQINPHFLYNTLETISAIGAMHQAFQVCDLCQRLGDVFRYSLGKNQGKYTALANEIRQTQNYIFIQQVRYRFEVFYSIDVDDQEVCVLRFLLQPIVENAVLHGLAQKEDVGTLEVHAAKVDGHLEIRISDDGAGMSEQQLETLRAQVREDTFDRREGANLGVRNIAQRIRLAHGDEYGVDIFSHPGQGCSFVLRLPFLTREMMEHEEVQATDRG